jgi:hypothetical protein
MRKTTPPRKPTVALACLAVVLAAGAWRVVDANGRDDDRPRADLRVIGLTDDSRLVSFRATSPERARQIGYVSGLIGADTALVGIDFRVQDGKLYGVGNGGGVYTRYAHLASFGRGLTNGVTVKAGEQIGLMGNTAGYQIPMHLHYELLLGDYAGPKASFGLEPVNPMSFPAAP